MPTKNKPLWTCSYCRSVDLQFYTEKECIEHEAECYAYFESLLPPCFVCGSRLRFQHMGGGTHYKVECESCGMEAGTATWGSHRRAMKLWDEKVTRIIKLRKKNGLDPSSNVDGQITSMAEMYSTQCSPKASDRNYGKQNKSKK